jgi:hypothetical protein
MHSLHCRRFVVALALGVVSCRGREGAPQASEAAGQVTAGGSAPDALYEIAVVQDRLWLTTVHGVVVIDPVKESWGMLTLGSRRRYQPGKIIACGSEAGIELRDTLARIDLETQQGHLIPAPGLPASYSPSSSRVSCVRGVLWIYSGGKLSRVPGPGVDTTRYQIPWPSQTVSLMDFAAGPDGAVYFLTREPSGPPNLYRFDLATQRLDRLALPPNSFATKLEPVDQGLLILPPDRTEAWLLKSPQQIEAIPDSTRRDRLAEENGVVWVGASYDVSPTSYFVLRYIKDVAEPKDLVILEGWSRPRLYAVSHLGMLWAISGNRTRLLRVDPGAEELVSYALTDTSGTLVKKAFHLVKEGGEVLFFTGDTLKKFEVPPPAPPPSDSTEARTDSATSADLGQKVKRELLLDSDLLPVELQVLRRVRRAQYADELPLGLTVLPPRHEDLAKCKRGRDVLGKRAADKLEARNRLAVVFTPREDLSL